MSKAKVKFLVSQEFEEWLEIADNLDIWETGKLSASEKRILVTRFVGAAWDKIFLSGKYNPRAFFEKTGCLLTLDGSEDEKVRIEGCASYSPPKPVVNDDDSGDDGTLETKASDPTIDEVSKGLDVTATPQEPEVDSDVTDGEEVEVNEAI